MEVNEQIESLTQSEAGRTQDRIAAQRRAEQAPSSPTQALKRCREAREELLRLMRDCGESIRHSVRDIDAAGNVKTTTGHGIPSGHSSSAIVSTNHRARRARMEHLRENLRDCEATIDHLERGRALPAEFDLDVYIERLFLGVPNDDVMVVVHEPKAANR